MDVADDAHAWRMSISRHNKHFIRSSCLCASLFKQFVVSPSQNSNTMLVVLEVRSSSSINLQLFIKKYCNY